MLKFPIVFVKHGCGFHTSCNLAANPGRAMRKVMGATTKEKLFAKYATPVLSSIISPKGHQSVEAKISGNPKRRNMLNKLFMKHITDIMSTGRYSKELLGHGIEINKVNVSPDYKFLNVFYVSALSPNQDEIEQLLTKNAGLLRHELSSLKVMGNVPYIVFVKDKTHNNIAEVMDRLSRADFGEDYELTEIGEEFKSEFEILTALEPNIREKVESLDSLEEEQEEVDHNIPQMPQNVLGLNHADILKRVKKGIKRSKASHRSDGATEWLQWSEYKAGQPMSEDTEKYTTQQQQREVFKAFIKQRQLLKAKQRADKLTEDDKYYEEEIGNGYLDKFLEDYVEENDYIFEEDDDKYKNV